LDLIHHFVPDLINSRLTHHFEYLNHSGVVAWVIFGVLLLVFLVSRFGSDVLEPLWIKIMLGLTSLAALAVLVYPYFDDVLRYPLANGVFSMIVVYILFALLMISKARFAAKDSEFQSFALRTARSLELSGNHKVATALRAASVDMLGHLQV
jgi:magnesium-transporting ATPase (P-type)